MSYCTAAALIVLAVTGYSMNGHSQKDISASDLVLVSLSSLQWTGIAVNPDDRIFVCIPRWSPVTDLSLAELHPDGQLVPFPDSSWQSWTPETAADGVFVCVQSVFVCSEGFLWILDTGSPWLTGVIEGGARLFKFDLDLNRIDAVYTYGQPELSRNSYLNDVRIDNTTGTAYLTDSGQGSLIVTDLETGESRRLLDQHFSTRAEDIVIAPGGVPWLLPGGQSPAIHSDGIALSPDGEYLYYHALTGRTLYRIPTDALRNPDLNENSLEDRVESVCETGPVDGMIFDSNGTLYLSLIEEDAIGTLEPGTDSVTVLVTSEEIRWPDSFALGPEGTLYFTNSQIHLGAEPDSPYTILALPGESM